MQAKRMLQCWKYVMHNCTKSSRSKEKNTASALQEQDAKWQKIDEVGRRHRRDWNNVSLQDSGVIMKTCSGRFAS